MDGNIVELAGGLVGLVLVSVKYLVERITRHLRQHLHVMPLPLPFCCKVVDEEILWIEPLYDYKDFCHLHFQSECIGIRRVEHLVRPHERHHVRVANIDNVVRVSWRDANDLQFLSAHLV